MNEKSVKVSGSKMSINYNIAKGTVKLEPWETLYTQQGAATASTNEGNTRAARNWPRVFLTLSAISMGLMIASSILNFISLRIGPATFFLDMYLIIFCFFALTAELRQIDCLRGLIYKWMRYLYFITTYTGRGLFYIFLGSLAFGDGILRYAATAIAIVLGVMMLAVNMCVRLPSYVDPEVAREEEAYRAAAGIGHTHFAQPTATGDYRFHNSEQTSAWGSGTGNVYKSPGIDEGPNAL